METTAARSNRHGLIDDAQGLAYGSFMASVGVILLTHLGLVTGQTAGLALLIAYATGWGFGPVFFVVNLPFYWLGYRRLGLAFMLKSFIAVAALSVLVSWLPSHLQFGAVHPGVGAVLIGCLLPGKPVFAINSFIADRWWVKPAFRFFEPGQQR